MLRLNFDIHELRKGDIVRVKDDDGESITYVVIKRNPNNPEEYYVCEYDSKLEHSFLASDSTSYHHPHGIGQRGILRNKDVVEGVYRKSDNDSWSSESIY